MRAQETRNPSHAAGAFVKRQCRSESCAGWSVMSHDAPFVVFRIVLGCSLARKGTTVPYRKVRIDLSLAFEELLPACPLRIRDSTMQTSLL